ncbi:MAG: restriction endonuclease subunit S [Sandaracinaceae bacterium]|nr:restriction endonuclease subunit S [Sandaracinaceae bacterium]
MATPEGWRTARLGDEIDVRIGGTPSRRVASYWATGDEPGHPWAAISDLRGRFVSATAEAITDEGVARSNVKAVDPGTVLMSFKLTIGRVAFASVSLFTNEAIAALVPFGAIDTEFLYYAAPTAASLGVADDAVKGKTLNKAKIRELPLLLPPLPEQRKIAAILSSVDETIEKTEAVIAQLQVVKKAMMQELLTRGMPGRHTRFKQTEIGEIPEGWSIVQIGDLGLPGAQVVRSGPFGSSLKTKDFLPAGTPVLTIQSLGEGRILHDGLFYVGDRKARELSEYEVQENDLVFSRVADIGRCAAISADEVGWLISSNLTRVRLSPDRATAAFLMYLLTLSPLVVRQIEMLVGSGGRPVITSSTLRDIRLPLPPLEEQWAITEACRAADARAERERQEMHRLLGLKSALSSALLSGDLRVASDPSEEPAQPA